MTGRILTVGAVNIEVSINIEKFPIQYTPINFAGDKINITFGGTGMNISSGFKALGADIDFVCLTGNDLVGQFLRHNLEDLGFDKKFFFIGLEQNPLSVVMYDESGKRRINSDHKGLHLAKFPEGFIKNMLILTDYSLAVLCNVNFTRAMIPELKAHNIPIACDIQAIPNSNDDYCQEFIKAADIIFFSHENLDKSPEHVIENIVNKNRPNHASIAVVGLGKDGCLMGIAGHDKIYYYKAPDLRPVINTVGAGDALFSSFLHFFNKENDPFSAMKKAQIFASWKTGESGANKGFLSEDEVNRIAGEI